MEKVDKMFKKMRRLTAKLEVLRRLREHCVKRGKITTEENKEKYNEVYKVYVDLENQTIGEILTLIKGFIKETEIIGDESEQ